MQHGKAFSLLVSGVRKTNVQTQLMLLQLTWCPAKKRPCRLRRAVTAAWLSKYSQYTLPLRWGALLKQTWHSCQHRADKQSVSQKP